MKYLKVCSVILVAFSFVFIPTQSVLASFATEVSNDGAVSHWNFEESSGNLLDQIGSNDGTLVGTPDRQQSAQVGSGYNFISGDTEGINLANDIFNAQAQGAIEAIVKVDSATGQYGIFAQGDSDGDNDQLFLSILDGQVQLHTRLTSTTPDKIVGNTTLNAGELYHIVGQVSDAGGMQIFINGVEDTPYTGSPSNTYWFADTTSSLAGVAEYAIGYLNRLDSSNAIYYDGVIDELAIYDAAQASSTWLSHYEAAFLGDSVSISSPVSYEVIQRDSNDQADISVSGSYNGSPTAIEARFNGGSWATVDASPSGGSFSGTLSTQDAGQGALEVRFTNATSTNDSVSNVGIGDVYAIAGQSNASGRGNNNQSYSHPTLKASMFTGSWSELTDPADGQGGTVWPLVATLLMDSEDVPVGFITDPPEGGTNISAWQKGGSLYTTLSNRIGSVGEVKAVLYWQGERDIVEKTSQSAYNSSLDSMAADILSDFGVKTVVAQVGEFEVQTDAAAKNNIRLAQLEAWEDNNNVLAGPSTYDVNLTDDGLHFFTDSELQTAANRWWAAIESHFYGGADGRGPQYVSSEENSSRDKVAVIFSDNTLPLLPSSGLEGFRVEDDGTPVTISNTTRIANNAVSIELASALSGSATVSLGYGDTANGSTTPTDSSTYNLPAEVFINESVSTASAPTISSVSSSVSTSSATISWSTNEAASNQIEYGMDNTYGATTTEENTSNRVTSHSQTISGLSSCAEYHYRVRSSDVADNLASSSDDTFTTTCTGNASVSQKTSASVATSGDTVSLNSGDANISLSVPNGFATSSATFQMKQIDKTTFLASAGMPSGKARAGNHAYNLIALTGVSTKVSSFSQPISITITYSDSDISELDESSLEIQRYDGSSWNQLSNCSVDTDANTVTCETSQFSDFALFGEETNDTDSGSSSSSRSGGTVYGCNDPNASNYDFFTAHKQSLCEYGTMQTNDIQSQIEKLQALVAELQAKIQNNTVSAQQSVSISCTLDRDLEIGMEGADVRCLQESLNGLGFMVAETGPGSVGNETDYFGPMTEDAVIRLQDAHAENILTPVGLSSGTGYVGPSTRGFLE